MSSPRKHGRRKNIQNSDPGKILDLVMSLNDDTCPPLQVKVNAYLTEECEAELVFMIAVNVQRMEAAVDAVGSTVLPRKRKLAVSECLDSVLSSAGERIELLTSLDCDILAIITPYLQMKDKEIKRRVIMYPIPDQPFTMVVCVVSPKVQEEHVIIYIHECFLFIWPTMKKCLMLEYESTLKDICQKLLRVAKRLFSQVASLDTLLNLAMEQAKMLTRAQYCSVMLVDAEKMQLVESFSQFKDDRGSERRYPVYTGIPGYVIKTGQLVNTKMVKSHPAYDPDIDSRPKMDCQTMLCFPIRERAGIIGVGQLINKIGDPYFDGTDEEMAMAFSIYCGICITHSVVYQKIQEAQIRNSLANELIIYHMKVSDTEVSRLLDCGGFHGHPHIGSLHFNPRALPLRELPCYALKMFSDLGFDTKFDLKRPKLARFILHVKKGYRDVPYHSWLHAFNVAQWAYAALINFKLVSQGYINDLQALMYLVAALVHDLDHRGTTNNFQIQGQTTLAALYASEGSVMERHHLAQAMSILNTEGCDILDSLPRRDYDRAIMMLRDFILATDLTNYFRNMNDYKVVLMDFQKGNRLHSNVLMALLMNAADLSDQVKDWGSVKKTAVAVITEFFKQGDVEKSRGDLPQMPMDRERCFIPDLEIQFMQTTCLPLFDMIGSVLPKAAPCTKIIENHIERWDAAISIFAELPITSGLSVLLSPELDNLIEMNLKEKERLRQEAEAEAEAAEAN